MAVRVSVCLDWNWSRCAVRRLGASQKLSYAYLVAIGVEAKMCGRHTPADIDPSRKNCIHRKRDHAPLNYCFGCYRLCYTFSHSEHLPINSLCDRGSCSVNVQWAEHTHTLRHCYWQRRRRRVLQIYWFGQSFSYGFGVYYYFYIFYCCCLRNDCTSRMSVVVYTRQIHDSIHSFFALWHVFAWTNWFSCGDCTVRCPLCVLSVLAKSRNNSF